MNNTVKNNYDISIFSKKNVKENERCVEIYKIICIENNKCYIGQTVSHILNNGKYRRFGMQKRLLGHISEAFSNKKHQCHYLNNAIRKYGAYKFEVELLETCSLENSDDREAFYIVTNNTMYPNGYNLKLGTVTTRLSEEGRRRVSDGVYNFYKDKKFDRFKNVKISEDEDILKFIRPLLRNSVQYGWYVYINKKKADFGGVHIPLEISKQRAIEFIKTIQQMNIAKHLITTGSPLEP